MIATCYRTLWVKLLLYIAIHIFQIFIFKQFISSLKLFYYNFLNYKGKLVLNSFSLSKMKGTSPNILRLFGIGNRNNFRNQPERTPNFMSDNVCRCCNGFWFVLCVLSDTLLIGLCDLKGRQICLFVLHLRYFQFASSNISCLLYTSRCV